MPLSKPAQEALYALAAGPLSHGGLCASLSHRHRDTVRAAHRELERSTLVERRGGGRNVVYEITTLGQEAVRTQSQTNKDPGSRPRVETQGEDAPASRESSTNTKDGNEKKCSSSGQASTLGQVARTHGDPGWEAYADSTADYARQLQSQVIALLAQVDELAAENAELRARVSHGEGPCSTSSRAAESVAVVESTSARSPDSVATGSAPVAGSSPSGAERPSDSPRSTESASGPPAQAGAQATTGSATPADGAEQPTAVEIQEAIDFRVEQQRPKGFKNGEPAFRKHMKRAIAKNPREALELLDEKREAEEAKAREPRPVAPSAPARPAHDVRLEEAMKRLRATRHAT